MNMKLINPFVIFTFFSKQTFIKNLYQKELLGRLNTSIPTFYKIKHIKEYKSIFDEPEYIPNMFKYLDF
jgi:hypothetical protein